MASSAVPEGLIFSLESILLPCDVHRNLQRLNPLARLDEDAGQENLAASGPSPSIRALKSRLSARISAGSATVDRRPARGRRRPLPVSRSVSQRKTAKGRRHYSAALSNQANGQLGSPRRDGLYFPLGSILPPFDAHSRRMQRRQVQPAIARPGRRRASSGAASLMRRAPAVEALYPSESQRRDSAPHSTAATICCRRHDGMAAAASGGGRRRRQAAPGRGTSFGGV